MTYYSPGPDLDEDAFVWLLESVVVWWCGDGVVVWWCDGVVGRWGVMVWCGGVGWRGSAFQA